MRTTRLLLFILIATGMTGIVRAQEYNNRRYVFGNTRQSVFYGVCIRQDTVYVAGTALDTAGYFNTLYTRIYKGEMIDFRLYNLLNDPDGPHTFYVFTSPRFTAPDRLVNFCSISANHVARITMYPWADSMSYDTFPHIYAPYTNFTGVADWKPTRDSGFIVVYNPGSSQLPYIQYGVAVMRLDKHDQVSWQKILQLPLYERANRVIQTRDGGFLIGMDEYDYDVNLNNKDRGVIIKLDSLGNQEWIWESPVAEFWGPVSDVFEDDAGGVIALCEYGKEVGNALQTDLFFKPFVFRINQNHQIDWKTNMGDGQFGLDPNHLTCMTKANEQDGVVAGGNLAYQDLPAQVYNQPGWIVKVGFNGDSIWGRTIHILDDSVYFDSHVIQDIKPDPNGDGYWLAGYVFDSDASTPSPHLRGWLIKTDNFGCVVPGCQLPVATDKPEDAFETIRVGPNPCRDYTAIYIPPLASASPLSLSVTDAQGNTVFRTQSVAAGSTFVLPTADFPAGAYFMQVSDPTGRRKVLTFVKN